MAAVHAVAVATTVRVSKRCSISSKTKSMPPIGALNAVARPAPAPAASSAGHCSRTIRTRVAIIDPSAAPICTVGPSRPSASPPPMARMPPKNLTGITRAVRAGARRAARRRRAECRYRRPPARSGAPSTRRAHRDRHRADDERVRRTAIRAPSRRSRCARLAVTINAARKAVPSAPVSSPSSAAACDQRAPGTEVEQRFFILSDCFARHRLRAG